MFDDFSGFLDQATIDKIMKDTPPDKVKEALRAALQSTSKPGRKKR